MMTTDGKNMLKYNFNAWKYDLKKSIFEIQKPGFIENV